MVIDICSIKSKLEKGVKALEFLDANIIIMSNWLTEIEQKLDQIEDSQLPDRNLKAQIDFIKVRFIAT